MPPFFIYFVRCTVDLIFVCTIVNWSNTRECMTKKIKTWKLKYFILVPGVRGSQLDHSGRQHLPHRLFPRRTIHEVKTEHEHKEKHRQYVFRYGSQVLKYLSHDQVARSDLPNPMCTVFPTVTRYGHRILLFIILNHVHFIKKNLTEHRTNLSNCFISFRKYIETHILSLCISVCRVGHSWL